MNYIPSKKSAVEISSDCLIIGVYNKNILSVAAEIINKMPFIFFVNKKID